jgi:hypothetical protein
LWDYSWASPLQNYQEWLDFNQVLNEGSRTCVDGEMPYDGPGDFNLNFPIAESYNFARRLRAHGYTSFSIVHNYNTNINAWKTKYINASDLQNDNVPVTDGYFVNSNGQIVSRSLYEYIRDHLGYRLQLTDGYFPTTVNIGNTYNFTVNLKNFGFAAPVNPHEVYFTLIDASGTMKKFLTTADSRSWSPYNLANNNSYTISADMFIDGSFIPGTYNIGIWIPDPVNQLKYNPEYAVKFANKNIQWWTDPNNEHLVNIIGQVIVE